VPLTNLGLVFGLPADFFNDGNYWQNGDVDVEAYGVFLQGRYSFTDAWALTLGARYNYEKREGTGSFIFDALQRYGYYPRTEEFIAGAGSHRVHSGNIVAVKDGETARQLVIGAHYDTTGAGQGYTDNATGVGLLLEAAARLKPRTTPYTVVFVALGAGEQGALGAEHYVRSMSAAQREATLAVLDLDTVAGGAQLVATNVGAATWLRDDALSAAKSLGIAVHSPAATRTILPGGGTRFAARGIATVTLTSAGWAPLSAPPRHTRKDSVAIIEKTYPGRVKGQLEDLSRLLETLLTSKLETHL
jgi:hypothetical protein